MRPPALKLQFVETLPQVTYSFLKAPLLLPCKHLLDLDFDMEIIQKRKKINILFNRSCHLHTLVLWK